MVKKVLFAIYTLCECPQIDICAAFNTNFVELSVYYMLYFYLQSYHRNNFSLDAQQLPLSASLPVMQELMLLSNTISDVQFN